jgi:DNA-dependent protein kinase catalytic subunit
MVDELTAKHSSRPHWAGLKAIVRGDAAHNARARYRESGDILTPEQQAQCLLDQATDPNILGRTYTGWRPWM